MKNYIYYCYDCGDDWSTNEIEIVCTQCLGTNIEEIL
jgi:DNA-directed RNA polymerase subunit RPC12/RpoP